MAAIFSLFKNKWLHPLKDVKESYSGRNVIVTGANTGIGFEAVAKFAALGAARVILAVRDLEKGETAKTAIEARLGKKDQLEVWELDMNSFDSVVSFAKRASTLEHLDIAILNAGVRRTPFVQSTHGWEDDMQVNTLASTLLGILLLPKLKESKQHTGKIPVLEFVNSGLHQNAKIDAKILQEPSILQAYNRPENFGAGSQYALTKLFLMYATNKLAEEVSSGDVIITSVCPGMVSTELGRDVKFPGSWIVIYIISALIMGTAEQGSRIILSGTTQGEQVHGRFWKLDQVRPIAPSIAGEENKKIGLRVWNEIVQALKKDVPAVTEALDSITNRG